MRPRPQYAIPNAERPRHIESAGEAGHVYLSGELKELLPQERTGKAGAFELRGIRGKTTLYKLV
jgi:class 3 adenylate cyclase